MGDYIKTHGKKAYWHPLFQSSTVKPKQTVKRFLVEKWLSTTSFRGMTKLLHDLSLVIRQVNISNRVVMVKWILYSQAL